jgi:two-component system sensor histidine kinase KdpD
MAGALHERASPEILIAVSGSSSSERVLAEGSDLARRLGVAWAAVHVETPQSARKENEAARAADLLAAAAREGADVLVIPAASVADGLLAALNEMPATVVVLGSNVGGSRLPAGRRVSGRLLRKRPDLLQLTVASVPPASSAGPLVRPPLNWQGTIFAAGAVLVTSLVALALAQLSGIKSLGLLFLFPVLTAAARRGIGSALTAAVLSVLTYNLLFLDPWLGFSATAPQTWLMTAVLIPVAVYASILTSQLRGRLRLSERSAAQSAGLASLALDLTRASGWSDTAEVICAHVARLFDIRVTVVRFVGSELRIEASEPADLAFEPIDRVALEWCWAHGELSGSGSENVSSANWQFHALATSLGTLAVLGIAREDGRPPLRADQQLLFATITAQAALAHERLRLEGGE